MKNWKPIDIIILIITLVVGFTISFSVIKPSDRVVNVEAGKLIAGVVGSLVSIISIYVGSKLKQEKDEK